VTSLRAEEVAQKALSFLTSVKWEEL
jgi:hypothetical protein